MGQHGAIVRNPPRETKRNTAIRRWKPARAPARR